MFHNSQEILAASRQPLRLDRPAFEQGNWWEAALPTPGSEAGPCGMWSHLEHPDVRVGPGCRRPPTPTTTDLHY